ncbi:MAG: TIR domain-containing protein [Patescibacteria group bacterium]|nr:TIR domain-containing protein [Patescibacteria group bacterium]
MNYYNNLYKSNSKTKVFISFDYDHDLDLKNLLVGQAKNDDSPFEITDMSVKEELTGDWKEKVRTQIKKVDQVIVICGEYTNTANGVAAEVKITQEEEKQYFLLCGRNGKTCVKPKNAKDLDKIYNWTWDNLKLLLEGKR